MNKINKKNWIKLKRKIETNRILTNTYTVKELNDKINGKYTRHTVDFLIFVYPTNVGENIMVIAENCHTKGHFGEIGCDSSQLVQPTGALIVRHTP